MRRQRRRSRARVPWVVIAPLTLLLVLGLFLGAQWLENRSRAPEAHGDFRQRYAYDTLTEHNGVTYRLRKNVTTILLIGVDVDSSGSADISARGGGQADFLRLLVIDEGEKKVTQIAIDRDTITPITILGVTGRYAGKRETQIALSHSFGDGAEESCGYTVKAVSELLSGVPINFYMAINLDGISVINDQVGGVTVTLEDDFTHLDPAMKKGETLTLLGDQAEYYVRSRWYVDDGTNEARMLRQQNYLSLLSDKIDSALRSDKEFVGTLYDALTPYLTTDIARGRLINEAWNARNYQRAGVIEPTGIHKLGEGGYMEFHVDKAALYDTVLALFYEPLK